MLRQDAEEITRHRRSDDNENDMADGENRKQFISGLIIDRNATPTAELMFSELLSSTEPIFTTIEVKRHRKRIVTLRNNHEQHYWRSNSEVVISQVW
jgi:hypothetical protein